MQVFYLDNINFGKKTTCKKNATTCSRLSIPSNQGTREREDKDHINKAGWSEYGKNEVGCGFKKFGSL